MKFTPKTEEQIKEDMLIPDGTYSFEVVKAWEEDDYGNQIVDKNGEPMLVIKLKVYLSDNSSRLMKCNLTPSFPKILKHFCDISGLEEEYKNGEVAAKKCLQAKINGLVMVKKGEYTNKNGERISVNNVNDFIPSSIIKENEFGDGMPF